MKRIISLCLLVALHPALKGQTATDNLPVSDTARPGLLETVIVTAQKTEQKLQKVPIAVSAITSRQVREYRLWSLEDLSALAPNLYTANPGDNRNVTGIRGIVTTSYDPAVVTYVDGVNQFSLDTYIPQLLDV